MSEEMISVSLGDVMTFECSSQLTCFNECCRDLNQSLMPYDILRLKNNLGITSDLFLKKYTLSHFGPESGFPVVTLRFDSYADYVCPFLTPKGCAVYKDRPASCRMYPLARALVKSRKTGEITEYFALMEESHCKGFGKKGGQILGDWLKGQDVELHNTMNDRLMELIALKNRIIPGELDKGLADKFYLACYDLDTFKEEIFNNSLLKDFNVPLPVLEKAQNDETVLLDLGIAWVKYEVFGIEYH